jgi:hypothetical protein
MKRLRGVLLARPCLSYKPAHLRQHPKPIKYPLPTKHSIPNHPGQPYFYPILSLQTLLSAASPPTAKLHFPIRSQLIHPASSRDSACNDPFLFTSLPVQDHQSHTEHLPNYYDCDFGWSRQEATSHSLQETALTQPVSKQHDHKQWQQFTSELHNI